MRTEKNSAIVKVTLYQEEKEESFVTLDQLYSLRCNVGRLPCVFPATKLNGPIQSKNI